MKPGKIPQHQVQWNVPRGQAIYISYTDDDDFSLAGKDILGQRIKPKVETEVIRKKWRQKFLPPGKMENCIKEEV